MANSKKKVAVKKKPVAVKKKKVSADPENCFIALLEVNGQVQRTTGVTALEAFSKFTITPVLLRARPVVHLKYGEKTASQILFGVIYKRFMGNKTSRAIWSKRIEAKLS